MAAEEANKAEDNEQKINSSYSKDVLKVIDCCKSNQGTKLDLSNRLIKSLPDELLYLSNLQYLYLEKNNLQELPLLLSENLTNLKWIDIRHNQLKSLPRNLFLLKNLKNLLLEGNLLTTLPLELGLLTSLSGLNLTNNPLEFPPKNVVESGTKVIIQFLREQLAIEQRFGQMDLDDVAPHSVNHTKPIKPKCPRRRAEERSNEKVKDNPPSDNDDDDDENESTTRHEYKTSIGEYKQPYNGNELSHVEYYKPHNTPTVRRHSLEEDMLNSPPYSVNSLLIKEREKAARRRKELSSSAPIRKVRQPKRKTEFRNAPPANPGAYNGYFRLEAIDSTYERAAKNAEQRAFNDKADAIIQKRKDKVNLEEWRWRTKQLQTQKYRSRLVKHEVKLPFGSDLQEKDKPAGKHAKDVSEVLDKNQTERMRIMRDKQLEHRIQEHAKHIREWKRKEKVENMEDELEITRNNLEKALNLQKELEEKRALQYRLRAFTAEDFAPKTHSDSITKNPRLGSK